MKDPRCISCSLLLESPGDQKRGIHATCLRQIGKIQISAPLRAEVCLHCPFRKDRPFWMDMGRKLMNLARLRWGIVQECHMDTNVRLDERLRRSGSRRAEGFTNPDTDPSLPTVHLCLGAVLCMQGGSAGKPPILSPAELRAAEPADSLEEAVRRYNWEGST